MYNCTVQVNDFYNVGVAYKVWDQSILSVENAEERGLIKFEGDFGGCCIVICYNAEELK